MLSRTTSTPPSRRFRPDVFVQYHRSFVIQMGSLRPQDLFLGDRITKSGAMATDGRQIAFSPPNPRSALLSCLEKSTFYRDNAEPLASIGRGGGKRGRVCGKPEAGRCLYLAGQPQSCPVPMRFEPATSGAIGHGEESRHANRPWTNRPRFLWTGCLSLMRPKRASGEKGPPLCVATDTTFLEPRRGDAVGDGEQRRGKK